MLKGEEDCGKGKTGRAIVEIMTEKRPPWFQHEVALSYFTAGILKFNNRFSSATIYSHYNGNGA